MRELVASEGAAGRPSDEGSVAVELALVITYFMIVFAGLVFCGLLFWIWNTMQLATDEGARYGSVMYKYMLLQDQTAPPTWSCKSGAAALEGNSPSLKSCVEAYVKDNLLNYGISPFGVPTRFAIDAECIDSTNSIVTCLPANNPDKLAIRVAYGYNFMFSPLTLTSKTTIPLL